MLASARCAAVAALLLLASCADSNSGDGETTAGLGDASTQVPGTRPVGAPPPGDW